MGTGFGPVNDSDIVDATWLYLSEIDEIVDAVGALGDAPYIFQRKIPSGTPVQQSQSSFIVIDDASIWTSPNEHNSMEFPRIQISLFVDYMRSTVFSELESQEIDSAEAYRRIHRLYKIVDKYMHRPQNDTLTWGAVRVHSSKRLAAGKADKAPQQDGVIFMDIYYALTTD